MNKEETAWIEQFVKDAAARSRARERGETVPIVYYRNGKKQRGLTTDELIDKILKD